jgi:hypothetical protein
MYFVATTYQDLPEFLMQSVETIKHHHCRLSRLTSADLSHARSKAFRQGRFLTMTGDGVFVHGHTDGVRSRRTS